MGMMVIVGAVRGDDEVRVENPRADENRPKRCGYALWWSKRWKIPSLKKILIRRLRISLSHPLSQSPPKPKKLLGESIRKLNKQKTANLTPVPEHQAITKREILC